MDCQDRSYFDLTLSVDKSNSFINATKACKDYNKVFKRWTANPLTKTLIDYVNNHKVENGVFKEVGQDTFIHPILLPMFAAWLSNDNAYQMSELVLHTVFFPPPQATVAPPPTSLKNPVFALYVKNGGLFEPEVYPYYAITCDEQHYKKALDSMERQFPAGFVFVKVNDNQGGLLWDNLKKSLTKTSPTGHMTKNGKHFKVTWKVQPRDQTDELFRITNIVNEMNSVL